MNQVKAAGCPALTAADTIQVAGAASVAFLGGPVCPLLMGRPDSGTTDVTANLPNPCDDDTNGVAAGGAIGRFTSMGFTDPVKALTVLSGSHNVGRSRTTQRSTCSKGLVGAGARAGLLGAGMKGWRECAVS